MRYQSDRQFAKEFIDMRDSLECRGFIVSEEIDGEVFLKPATKAVLFCRWWSFLDWLKGRKEAD